MSTFIKTIAVTAFAAIGLISFATGDDTTPANQVHPEWQAQLVPVPQLLRLHFPILSGDSGLLVASIHPESPAVQLGLHAGDVVLQVNGKSVRTIQDLPPIDQDTIVLTLHQGQVTTSSQPVLCVYPPYSGGVPNGMPFDGMVQPQNLDNVMSQAFRSMNQSTQRMQQRILDTQLPAAAKQQALRALNR